MFKNKHVVVAMLVAPVLSILAWLPSIILSASGRMRRSPVVPIC